MTTGERIKAARVAAGLTQSELSSKLEVPFQSVSQWERGTRNPKLATIKRIANALGITVAELMGLSDVDAFKTELYTGADLGLAEYRLQKNFGFDEEQAQKIAGCIADTWKDSFRTEDDARRKVLFDSLNPDGVIVAENCIRGLSYVPDYKKRKTSPDALQEIPEKE